MSRKVAHLLGLIFGLVVLLSSRLASAASEKATQLNAVADSRDMTPGLNKFLADTYNANLWLYGLYVVLIMATLGLVLGFGVDQLMKLTGLNLGKMDHHE